MCMITVHTSTLLVAIMEQDTEVEAAVAPAASRVQQRHFTFHSLVSRPTSFRRWVWDFLVKM